MNNGYFPNWLYKSLPFFYVGAGLLAMSALHNLMAVFAGLTLISAGGIVWMLRHNSRRNFVPVPARVHPVKRQP